MTSLRFMSWNWNCFSDNRNELKCALIKRLAPDVVALQEVDDNACGAVERWLPGWTLLLPPRVGANGGSSKRRPQPAVGLLARNGLALDQLDGPVLDSWTSAEARDGRGFDPDFTREDDAFPEARSFVGGAFDLGGRRVEVFSAHPPHAAGRDPELVKLRILLKRRTYAVLRTWLSGRDPLVLGMDANAWVDSGLHPLEDPLFLEAGNPQNDIAMFVQNGYLAGHEAHDEPKDAFRQWLSEPEQANLRKQIIARRPNGPWATTYNRSMNHPYPDRRDLVMVSSDLTVHNVEHNYEDSLAAGSDHSYVLCDLEI